MQYRPKVLYIKFIDSDRMEDVHNPIYVLKQKSNGVVVSCNIVKAQGVVSSDSQHIYQFEGKPVMDPSYPVVKKITYAEYCEMMGANNNEDSNDDPEITDEEALNIIIGDIVE